MAKITFGTANGRKLNRHHIPINSIGTFAVNGRQVTGCIPLSRGDKVSVNYSQFSRLAPLVAPTFGSFNIKTMAFYVPAHTIWRGYRSWISNSADQSVQNAPLNFSLEDLVFLLTNQANPTIGSWDQTYFDTTTLYANTYTSYSAFEADFNANNFDFCCFINVSSTQVDACFGNFNARGREFWNTMITLGYNFPTLIHCNQSNVEYTGFDYSIYPLLAYARVCYDYLYPSAYVNQQGFSFLFETVLNTGWANAVTRRNYIEKMIATWFNQYDQDFYTSLWSKPNQVAVGSNQARVSPIGQGFSTGPLGDVTSSAYSPRVQSGDGASTMVGSEAGGTPFIGYTVANMSSLMLRWLTSVSDYALRNNLGGARFREFIKAHFGYNTVNDTCDESIFLKLWSDTVRIQDVTNMTSGSGSTGSDLGVLGELAGKGYANGTGTLKFEAKEAGFLLFVTECKPNVGYYQGNRPWARALNHRFQLYTPEFDGVGMEGVPRSSIFNAYDHPKQFNIVPDSSLKDCFGYTYRYSERYKVGHDNLFGDFRYRSRSRGMDSWHTMRDVLYGRSNLALDAQFLSVDNQYQRIFRYIGGSSDGVQYDVDDKIWCFLGYDITKYSTAKSLGQSLPFFEQNGQDANMNYLGSDIK